MTPTQLRELLEKDAERFHIEFGRLAPKFLALWETAEMLQLWPLEGRGTGAVSVVGWEGFRKALDELEEA